MSEPTTEEWQAWQTAWRAEPSVSSGVVDLAAALGRQRRAARLYTALDVFATVVFCAVGVVAGVRSRSLPVVVWAASLVVFSIGLLAVVTWSRRDALFVTAAPTTDFARLLQVRLARRERLPRAIAIFVAVEIAFGIGCFALWAPDQLPLAVLTYAVLAAPLFVWWHRQRRRLAAERAQLEALTRE